MSYKLHNLRPRKIILPNQNHKASAKKQKMDNLIINGRILRSRKMLSSNKVKRNIRIRTKVKSVKKKTQIKKSQIKMKTKKMVAALPPKRHTKVAAKKRNTIKSSQVKKSKAKLFKTGAGQNHRLFKNLAKGGTSKKVVVKKRKNMGPLTSSTAITKDTSKKPKYSCAICLNDCTYPVKLPCTHIFCFLCAKGAILRYGSCALCRQVVTQTFLHNPVMVGDTSFSKPSSREFKWFYEGYIDGWWQYDDHSNDVIEEAFQKSLEKCDVVIAGYVYEIDLKEKTQRRKYEFSITRRIKRDKASICKKGIAGIHTPPSKKPLMLSRLQ